ncbi:hypothetical protein BDBG_18048 [Blastomyces gilchristii SLH14081]|uniref:Uncharacterized protein n=1 Tax=Blastomyces gilchristii (strain SLH14081) TaxID=559298 RepID=A0A179V4R1_BLAGS|nr:uncharacterized protein BDBG_18048 [Blastomyces gilchristii SLH14081]EQL30018.1 hypothetical protein BDFG_07417 [Blastomyces dermatitidis ATCC 26199]OAT14458.1 hypothetical protein BDBG_18048 [Blastomyces gilchristii SLH14081]
MSRPSGWICTPYYRKTLTVNGWQRRYWYGSACSGEMKAITRRRGRIGGRSRKERRCLWSHFRDIYSIETELRHPDRSGAIKNGSVRFPPQPCAGCSSSCLSLSGDWREEP